MKKNFPGRLFLRHLNKVCPVYKETKRSEQEQLGKGYLKTTKHKHFITEKHKPKIPLKEKANREKFKKEDENA